MASCEMRMDGSSGKSTTSRFAICSGDQPLTHLRSPRWGLLRPMNGACRGPPISLPLASRILPSRRSWTYWCRRWFFTSLAGLGLLANSSDFHCATDARYSSLPARVAALRVNSRETVGGASTNTTSNLPHTNILGSQKPNLFSLGERQIPSGNRFGHEQWHASTMPEPARANGLRYANCLGGLLTGHSGGDLSPELPLHLAPKRGRTRRAHCPSSR